MNSDYSHAACVEIQKDALYGGFLTDPVTMFRVVTLATFGQEVLCTPADLAKVWDIDKRLVGKVVHTLRPTVSVHGDGYVRALKLLPSVVRSSRDYGIMGSLEISVRMGWKMPEGPVSSWRTRQLAKSIRDAVKERDGGVCQYCGATEGKFHIDHILPVAKGGRDDLDNLCLACAKCNLTKSDMTVEEFRKKQAGLE